MKNIKEKEIAERSKKAGCPFRGKEKKDIKTAGVRKMTRKVPRGHFRGPLRWFPEA